MSSVRQEPRGRNWFASFLHQDLIRISVQKVCVSARKYGAVRGSASTVVIGNVAISDPYARAETRAHVLDRILMRS